MVDIEVIKRLLSSSILGDLKLGCVYLAKYPEHTIYEVIGKPGEGYKHKCTDVPEYMPEHRVTETMSLIIDDIEIYYGKGSTYPNNMSIKPHPDEFF